MTSWNNKSKNSTAAAFPSRNRDFSKLLEEDGGYLLLEDGGFIYLVEGQEWAGLTENSTSFVMQTKN